MAKRPSPIVAGRAGNYVAPVDTTAMDPEMQGTLGVGKPAPKSASFLDALWKTFGIGKKKKAKPKSKKV